MEMEMEMEMEMGMVMEMEMVNVEAYDFELWIQVPPNMKLTSLFCLLRLVIQADSS